MSAAVFVIVLGLFGVLTMSLVAWLILRLIVGGFWAFLGFHVTLVTTVWVLSQLIA